MPPYGAGMTQVQKSTNGMAVASLILGILWLSGLGSILAIIFGFIGRKKIAQSNGREGGNGLAIAGIVLGFVGVAGAILIFLFVIAVGSSINKSSTSYQDGRTYGYDHYSSGSSAGLVCNGPVPDGDSVSEFYAGCQIGWLNAQLSSEGNSGNSG